MKKLVVLLLLIIFPMTVNAALADLDVKELNASVESKTIKYSGKTGADSLAVMCKLYLGEDIVDYLSSEVNESKFEGTFTVNKAGKYTVYCANYSGGDIKSTEVEVVEETSSNPATSDKILGYVAVLLLCAIVVTGVILYFKKITKKD